MAFRAYSVQSIGGQPYVRAIRTAVENERPYVRSYVRTRTYVQVRTGLGMIGMLAECSSLPSGELFSATTDIAHDSDIPTIINTLPILKIAVAYRSNRAKVTGVQTWRFARIRYRVSQNYFQV